MRVFAYNSETGRFEQTLECELDPRASERMGKPVYLIPADTTDIPPLPPKEDSDVVWKNGKWEYVPHSISTEPQEYVPTPKELKQQELAEIEFKLRDSDYVALKLAEATAVGDGDAVDALLEKYEETLQNRTEWRQQVANLRAEISTME